MRNTRKRRWVVLVSMAIVAGAVWATVSLADTGGSKADATLQAVSCTPTNPQPAQPLEMNTVVVAGVAKTVAMEKELFDCQDPATGSTFSRDVETFVELIERDVGTNINTVARRVLVAICDKSFSTGKVACRSSSPPLGAPVGNPLLNCRPLPATGVVRTPADPVEMNSVAMGEFIKTIKLEKEVLACQNRIGDVYVFTEVIERRTTAASAYVPFATRFEGIMCLKNPQLGVIESCTRFTTT
jgi:hypothetical protein